MKLLSCDQCGVVLNQDIFDFDEDNFYEEDGSLKERVAIWNHDHYVAALECPVCKNMIETDFKV